MKIIHIKFSDAQAAAIEANCEATGRNMSDVIRECVSSTLARSPASRDGIVDMVLNPFVMRLQAAEAQIQAQNDRIDELAQSVWLSHGCTTSAPR